MNRTTKVRAKTLTTITLGLLGMTAYDALAQTALGPQTLPKLAEVDQRFLSYNIEAVEVTGGRFWKPYDSKETEASPRPDQSKHGNEPTGLDTSFFAYRPAIDLSNPKLRNLATALSPSFVRVSGTWRNGTYFQDNDDAPLATPPKGFRGVMTRAEWKGVVDFAKAVNAEIVTSVATSTGTRDENGVWTTTQAKAFFDYTKKVGGHITATEFMNEPNFAEIGGAPTGYDSASFARDIKVFEPFLRKESPGTIFLGPSGTGEGAPMIEGIPAPKEISTESLMKGAGPVFDGFSYHYYGTAARRCTAALGPKFGMNEDKALTAEWFQKNLTVEKFYERLRDQYLPGKPLWVTETGEAACGGDPWASAFLDSFRFMDQLGTLAQRNVQTVMVNTLASSDYGLLDDDTFNPRPNYWAALLWKRTMGARVLDPDVRTSDTLRVYAQCTAGKPGAVTYLLINIDSVEKTITTPLAGERYTLSTPDILGKETLLNGTALTMPRDGTVPPTAAQKISSGVVHLGPRTITFLTLPDAKNPNCK